MSNFFANGVSSCRKWSLAFCCFSKFPCDHPRNSSMLHSRDRVLSICTPIPHLPVWPQSSEKHFSPCLKSLRVRLLLHSRPIAISIDSISSSSNVTLTYTLSPKDTGIFPFLFFLPCVIPDCYTRCCGFRCFRKLFATASEKHSRFILGTVCYRIPCGSTSLPSPTVTFRTISSSHARKNFMPAARSKKSIELISFTSHVIFIGVTGSPSCFEFS